MEIETLKAEIDDLVDQVDKVRRNARTHFAPRVNVPLFAT